MGFAGDINTSHPSEVNPVLITPTLQMRRLRHREVQELAPVCLAAKRPARSSGLGCRAADRTVLAAKPRRPS